MTEMIEAVDKNLLFNVGNVLVIPFWLAMILLPRWAWILRIIRSPWIAAPPALVYAVLVLPQVGGLLGALSNPSLASIAALLGTQAGALIGWVHFLAFDLFVGRWAYLDAIERKIHPLIMAPILFFTFMLGPLGLLLYLVVSRWLLAASRQL